MSIKYSCLVLTRLGSIAKIDGEWYCVEEKDFKVLGIHFKLNALQREELDLTNDGETPKTWINVP